ncbi:MAG: LCP family protein [Bacilli bacterium]|nr:LCP family protein [Bacilli bacterium]
MAKEVKKKKKKVTKKILKERAKKKEKIIKILKVIGSILFAVFAFLCVSTFLYFLIKCNIVPGKYFYPVLVGILLLFISAFVLDFFSNKKILHILSFIVFLLLSIVSIIGSTYLGTTYRFLKHTQVKGEYLSYSVYVLKDSKITTIHGLKNKNISYIDDSYISEVQNELQNKIHYTENIHSNVSDTYDSLIKNNTNAIVLEKGYYSLAKEEIDGFADRIKSIYTFKVKVENKSSESKNTDVKVTEPFILYISGIDQYGDVDSVRGRSDVNQIMVINPKTNKILLVNTPRDYYVQLPGTTGLRDKLTHAGVYGIDKSVETLESIYDVDINHYVRINFDTLIKTVDIIGGIDVYSDADFITHTTGQIHINKGWNHFNGTQALAYSRERYAYIDGDHHRGRNQQQVIEAIINKITTSDTIIKKYNSILNSLDGSFQTDMDMSFITSCVKYQLDKKPTWSIETIQVTGSASWGYTYSMGYNYYLWVMEPDWNSVADAKMRIREALGK